MKKTQLYIILIGGGIFILVGAVFLVTIGRTMGQFMMGKSFAEAQLNEYVGKVLNQKVNGVNCQSMDTDKNGYVSCDYTTASQPDNPRSIECAAWGLDGFFNRGCKTRLPNFQSQ
jgi:hypothetical protein